jgi:hypothetical protein
MHNLHFILINADSAKGAACEADNLILHWGNENNWRRVGGVASEDGSDDIENHADGRWGLSYLHAQPGIPKEGTYFSRGLAYLHQRTTDPVALPSAPFSTHSNLRSAITKLSTKLRAFDPDHSDTQNLWGIGRDLKHLSALIYSRRGRERGDQIPEFYDWQFDTFGLTDMTEDSEGARRYLVFLDMHS